MKRSHRIKKSKPFSLREIRRLVLLPLLLLCGLAGSIYVLSFTKVFRQLVTQSSATAQSNGAMSLLSHSNWLLFITILFLAGGLWLYTWIDYHSHKRPLILEMPSVHYTLKHHLLVVSLPQARYNWRPLAYKSVIVTLYTAVFVFSSFISIRHAFAAAPVITTNPADNVTQTSARLQGTVSSTGTTDLTVRGFEYGTTTSYGSLTSDTTADTYQFATIWGSAGMGDGQFSGSTGPEGLAKDSAGNVYVLDGGNGRVEQFSAAGVYMSQFGTLGTGFGNFNYPHGISIDSSDNVYIADTSNNRVEKYSTAGVRLGGWGGYSPTPGDSNMYTPGGVAADQDGNIFVADTGHNRIQKFSNTGVFIAKWGTGGSGDGQFNNPYDVDTDPAGNVYVADEGNNRIQKFDNDGNFITQWGTTGTGNSQFTNPQAITVDNYGFVLVMDTHNHRLQKFTSNGNYVVQYGSLGTADGQFQYPVSIFTDTYGGVFVADSGNKRVVKLTPTISTGDYELTVRDLACNTTYHYRAFSVNASETGYGSDQTFTTTGCYAPNEFVTTWKTDNPGTSAINQITIPTYSGETYNYNVDWGDGNTSTGQTGDATHTYASAGTYTVKITGTFPRVYFNNSGDDQKILEVQQWGSNPWTSMANAFWGASNLTVTAGDAPNLSSVTNMAGMFGNATSFNSDISVWDVSSVTDMSGLFYGATAFNQPLNSWDVRNVLSMSTMFYFATSFNSRIDYWNVGNVTNISNMFGGATYFNQPLNSWDVSHVTNMSFLFKGALSFNQPLNSWNVSSVTSMIDLFSEASSFNQPLNTWDVSHVTNMNEMFANATVFNQPLDSWVVSSVTTMQSMFGSASNFDQNINSWNVSSVTDMGNMFSRATSFNQPLDSWVVSSVTNMSNMFSGYDPGQITIFNQTLSSWDTSSVTDMSYMFWNDTSFNQPLGSWVVSSVTTMQYMFNNATTFNQSLASWNVAGVTNMTDMFGNGSGLSVINYDSTLIGWNALTLQNGVTFDAGTSTYCSSATERANIISTFSWTINDSGENCPADTTSFITTWKTDNPGTSASDQITIPTYSGETYNYSVDWGDSSTSSGQTGDSTHTYASAGTYTVKITGTFPRIDFSGSGDSQKILTVEQWGSNPWTSMGSAFYGASNLTVTAGDAPDLSSVTDMSFMFTSATNFNSDISSWDVSSVTNMNGVFSGATSFNQPLNNWAAKLINVTSMSDMFDGATSFNQPLNNWNVSNVTDMRWMFIGASAFDQDISSWNVSNVTNMASMFNYAFAFNQPLNSWDVSNVVSMDTMFFGGSFNQPLASWNVSNVTDMIGMFGGGSGLSTINYDATLIGWNALTLQNGVTFDAGTSTYCSSSTERANIISTYSWTINDSGENCSADTTSFITTWKTDNPGTSASNQITIPTYSGETYNYNVDWGDSSTSSGQTGDATHTYASAGTYTVKITGTFSRIYFNGSGDKQKILTVEQWGTNPWTSMHGAFYGASNLTVPATDAPDLTGVTDMSSMFEGATTFNSDISSWDVSNVMDMSWVFQDASSFNQPLNSWNVSSVTNMNGMLISASAFNQSLSSWSVSNVTDMQGMFEDAVIFDQPLNSWDVSSVTNMSGMFRAAASFNQPLNSWDVSSVTNMQVMFYQASSFNQSLSSWSVSNVTDMQGMFEDAVIFDQPLNSWDVSSVTNMSGMFMDENQDSPLAFNQPLSSWNVSSVTDMSNMFIGATSFNQSLDSWNVSSVTDMHAMFAYASSFNQPLSSWNVSSVTNMKAMFAIASSFNQPLDSWDVSNGTNMYGMFAGASSFDQSLASWDVSNVTDMNYMFGDFGGYLPSSSGLSTANYDATLIGWNALTLQSGVTFDAGTSTYCSSVTERANIISTYSWTINDSGENCPTDTTSFITTWKTDNPGTSASNQITIPTYSGDTYNYDVDWGDSSTSSGQTGDATHTYASAGTYTVKITGTFPRIYFSNTGDRQKILTVEQWGTNPWTSMHEAFYGSSNLTVPATDTPNLSGVLDMTGMFEDASSFNSDISSWDVSSVTDMSNMFAGAISFNQPLDSWDVSNVTDMGYIFSTASSFNQPLDSWDVSSVTDMSGMFSSAATFNQDIDNWDVSNVTNMRHLFSFASAFNQPLNNWNVSSVTLMGGGVDLGGMFAGASAFNQPLNNWDVSNVTDMTGMFSSAASFNQDIDNWDVSNVTSMALMFGDISSWSVTSPGMAFNQPLNSWNVTNVTDMSFMFYGAINFNQPLNSWDVSNVTDMSGMFTFATNFNQPLNSWDVTNVTTTQSMFAAASSFNHDLGSWDVTNVTNMVYMFNEAMQISGEDFPASGLSTANYDATLAGWNALTLQSGVTFDAGTSTYCNSAAERANIISTYSWTINDSGENCPTIPQTDFSLTKTLLTPGPILAGDTVTYHFKIKNLGPNNSYYAGFIYDVLPTEFNFVSNTNANVGCVDMGLAEDTGIQYFADHFPGHHLVTCTPANNGSDALAQGASVDFDMVGTAIADFTSSSTINKSIYLDNGGNETADSAVINNASQNNVDFTTLPINNVSTQTYSYSSPTTPDPTPTPTYSCNELTAVADANNTQGLAPLDITFTETATATNTTIQNYLFDFGDGLSTSSATPKVTHTFSKSGTYRVRARVQTTSGTSGYSAGCSLNVTVNADNPTGTGSSSSSNGGSLAAPQINKKDLLGSAGLEELNAVKGAISKQKITDLSNTVPYYFTSFFLFLALLYAVQAYREYQRAKAIGLLVARYQQTSQNVQTFLSITSHYLNTPVAIMQSAIELFSSQKILPTSVTRTIYASLKELGAYVATVQQKSQSSLEPISSNVVSGASFYKGYSLLKTKKAWLPLAIIAGVITVLDIVFRLLGAYGNTNIRSLNHLIFYILSGLIMVSSLYFQQRQLQLRDKRQSLLDAEKALQKQKAVLFETASQTLEQYHILLSKKSEEFRSLPKTKVFFNGLAMLKKLCLSLSNVQTFSVVQSDAPAQNLKNTITSALQERASTISQKQLKVHTVASPTLSIQAKLDEAAYLVGSVLDNAVKFSPQNGSINISAESSRGGTTITTTNSGPTIPENKLNELFQPFNRATAAETFDYEGMGLGLFTNKILVEKLGGKLTVQNIKSGGVKVSIFLPKAKDFAQGQVNFVIHPEASS